MSKEWYISARFNTGLAASKVANDALMAMSVVSLNAEKERERPIKRAAGKKEISRAIQLFNELENRVKMLPRGYTTTRPMSDSVANLVLVLCSRAAGDVDAVMGKIQSTKKEMQEILGGRHEVSLLTLETLTEIIEAAQEVVESSKFSQQ